MKRLLTVGCLIFLGCATKQDTPVIDVRPTSGPSASERATIYLAAKTELEQIAIERDQLYRLREQIRSAGVDIPPELERNHQLRFELLRLKESNARQEMEDNRPSGT